MMKKDFDITVLNISTKEAELREVIKGKRIVYLVDAAGAYVGCYTAIRGINRDSKVVRQGVSEKEQVQKIFYENIRIQNLPVIDENRRPVYQYVREAHDALCSRAYWEERYSSGGNSGAGSYNRLAEFKADVVCTLIKENNINSIIEWGCGDGNQFALFLKGLAGKTYTGYDVSQTIVEKNREKYAGNGITFLWYDGSRQEVEKRDLALSLDVIFHLIEDSVFENYLFNLFLSSKRYVCIYSSNRNLYSGYHEKHRNFTKYVQEMFPEWEQISVIKNRYPYDLNDPENTSVSDFYIYRRKDI